MKTNEIPFVAICNKVTNSRPSAIIKKGNVSDVDPKQFSSTNQKLLPHLILLYTLWFTSSAIANNISKLILNNLPIPFYVSFGQFLSSFLISFVIEIVFYREKSAPFETTFSKANLKSALPISFFQIGSLFSGTVSMESIDISLFHMIKASAPLFSLIFSCFSFSFAPEKENIGMERIASIGMILLGVILSSSSNSVNNFNYFGIFCAFLTTNFMVLQNIFSKYHHSQATKTAEEEHLQKKTKELSKFHKQLITIQQTSLIAICIMAIVLMCQFVQPITNLKQSTSYGFVSLLFILHGISYFVQIIAALSLISLISPLAYSVAGIMKRSIVIASSIMFFKEDISLFKMVGIFVSLIGVILYNIKKQ